MQDSKRDTEIKNRLLDYVREGEGRMIWENGIETRKLSHMKRIASPGLMHDTGYSGQMHWDDPEGWNGEGDGSGGFRIGNTCTSMVIHVNVWQNQYNIVK